MIGEREALLHAKLPAYRRAVDGARRIIETGLSRSHAPFVACSFGKDSAALLHLVREFLPDIEARFIRWPESELLDNYGETIAQWESRGARVFILDLARSSLDEKTPDRWQKLRNLAPADGQFVGLRAEESKARRLTLRAHGEVYQMANGFWRICPLAWWSTLDVAAYVVTHQLPTLRAYQRDGFEARTASRVPRAQFSIREQALRRLRQNDPAAFQQLAQIYPEVTQWV